MILFSLLFCFILLLFCSFYFLFIQFNIPLNPEGLSILMQMSRVGAPGGLGSGLVRPPQPRRPGPMPSAATLTWSRGRMWRQDDDDERRQDGGSRNSGAVGDGRRGEDRAHIRWPTGRGCSARWVGPDWQNWAEPRGLVCLGSTGSPRAARKASPGESPAPFKSSAEWLPASLPQPPEEGRRCREWPSVHRSMPTVEGGGRDDPRLPSYWQLPQPIRFPF